MSQNTVLTTDMPADLLAKVTQGLEKIKDKEELIYLQSHLKYALAAYYTDSKEQLTTTVLDGYQLSSELDELEIIKADGTDFAGFVALANDVHMKKRFIVIGFRGTISLSDIWTDLNGDLCPTQPFYNGWWKDLKTIAVAVNSGQIPLQSSVLEEDKDAHKRRLKQSKRFGFQTSMRLQVDSGVALEWVQPLGVSAERLSVALDSVLSISPFTVPDGDDTTVTTEEAKEALLRWVDHFQEPDTTETLPFIQRGFWEGWAAIRQESLTLLNKFMDKYPDLDIHFVGHSLGGSFATLAAIEVLWDNEISAKKQLEGKIRLVTYGKPRIGNMTWAKLVLKNKAAMHARRVVNHADIIPHLPPFSRGFFHLPGEVWLCWTDGTTYRATDGLDIEGHGNNLENIVGLTPFHHFLSSYFYTQEWLIAPFPKPRARLLAEVRLEMQRGLDDVEDAAIYVYEHLGIGKGVVTALNTVEATMGQMDEELMTLSVVKEAEDDVIEAGTTFGSIVRRFENVAKSAETWVADEAKEIMDAQDE
jgi:hypothetical protein